jgi:LPS-assembly lipoprotein
MGKLSRRSLLARSLFARPLLALGGAGLALGSAGALAGCGFQPVYMPTASGQAGPARRELQTINVNLIPDRPGQLLRQDLQERLADDSGQAPFRYDLEVRFTISGEGIGIEQDTVATRVRMIGHASWKLRERNEAQTQITTGDARAMDAVNVIDQQFFEADLDTEQVQKRIASAVADQIALQLAAFFRHRAAVASNTAG